MRQSNVNSYQNGTPLYHGQIIILEHVNDKTYLHSQNIPLKQDSHYFKKQFEDKCVVDAYPIKEDSNNLWQVHRTAVKPQLELDSIDQSEIYYDDCIVLRHFITSRYLTNYGKNLSQVTRQGEICSQDECLDTEIQMFVIQRIQDPYIDVNNPEFVIENRVHSNTKIRIVSVSDDSALHTHPHKYSQSDANHLKEVTSFLNRDDNDYWELLIADDVYKDGIKIEQNNFIHVNDRLKRKINSSDKVIVRSSLMGTSLHSHTKNYYTGSKQQEVTCTVGYPRDQNDWWQIVSFDEKQEASSQIKHLGKIGLVHCSTKKYLTASFKFQNPSNKGTEVCCVQGYPKDEEWQLIVIKSHEEEDQLPLGYPFLIKHLPTGQHLSVFKNTSKPSETQMEIGLTKEISHANIWQIEQQNDSIFF